MGTVQVHMGPPPIPLIKSNNIDKSNKYFVKTKFLGDLRSENSNFDEFKMTLFDTGKCERFLLLIRNFIMTLEASGLFGDGTNIQYLDTMLHGEVLRQFEMFSAEVGSATPESLTFIILGLGTYFLTVNALSKKIA